ncbi:MAG: arsenite methyltransferase [Actinomycetales bacterium]|nr:arsenite methyltransferase [Candidatus Phosphoribacter baldrii]
MTAGPAPTHSEVSPGTGGIVVEGIVAEAIGTGAIGTEAVRAVVQERYAAAARTTLDLLDGAGSAKGSCCGTSCCSEPAGADPITRDLYKPEDAPSEGALIASLGCGNPTLLADLQPGQTVLDLGSGGGLDVLLSARRVAPGGTAYGLDMTPQMLELARRNQAEAGVENATFLLGTIEAVPLPDESIDVVISNCVINLSPDKDAVLGEAFRVLRPGGRFAVSDIVLLRPIPEELVGVVGLWTGCVSGALVDSDYLAKLGEAGFVDASIEVTRSYDRLDLEELASSLAPGELADGFNVAAIVAALEGAFASASIRATKPR